MGHSTANCVPAALDLEFPVVQTCPVDPTAREQTPKGESGRAEGEASRWATLSR